MKLEISSTEIPLGKSLSNENEGKSWCCLKTLAEKLSASSQILLYY